MRLVLQRVTYGAVTVDGKIVGQIDQGLVALVGITHEDTPAIAESMAQKTAVLRIFDDGEGKMNRSVLDVGGGVLAVSQFTLYANPKGRRPDYLAAARPELAEPLFNL
jgi:D-tyrosyl-tRNA(Tyr) deacylase